MLVHWHSYYDRLYYPSIPSIVVGPACRLPFDDTIRISANIHEVTCERCRLRFNFEIGQSLAKLRAAIVAGKRRCRN